METMFPEEQYPTGKKLSHKTLVMSIVTFNGYAKTSFIYASVTILFILGVFGLSIGRVQSDYTN
jgi:hypothetical protein